MRGGFETREWLAWRWSLGIIKFYCDETDFSDLNSPADFERRVSRQGW